MQFRWPDYADHHRVKVMALEANECLRRFLLQILPDRFVRIRHVGLLANHGHRQARDRCRTLLDRPTPPPATTPESADALILRVTGLDLRRCPVCGDGRMHITAILMRAAPAWPDTS